MESNLKIENVAAMVTKYEREIGHLEERNILLTDALKKIKEILKSEVSILVNVDVNNNQPGRSVRLYTETGKALGFGESVVSKANEGEDLFNKTYNTYKVSLNTKELFK